MTSLRIALASYRSKEHSGGQGVYVRNLSRELTALGHRVEVFSGAPYAVLDDGVQLTRVPGLDLYRPEDPFRRPALREFRSDLDVLEYATMCTAGFPEPRVFALRLERLLRSRIGDFDILHDNQTLAPGILRLHRRGLPLLTTIHHPITADRALELAAARGWQRVTKRRFYDFVHMQRRVARNLPAVLTVSATSAADIERDFGVSPERMTVVPVGVDVETFAPTVVPRVAGRLVTVASADVPLKGLPVLITALTRLDPAAWRELIVVGAPSDRTSKALAGAGLLDRVSFRSGMTDSELAALLGSAQVHVVPSLYEGFSLPAVEAMACGTPLVASRVGALPELIADDAGVLVEPGDADALAHGIATLLADPSRRTALGAVGRRRAVSTYSWRAVAEQTVAQYETAIEQQGASA